MPEFVSLCMLQYLHVCNGKNGLVLKYCFYHRVGRVLSFFSSRRNLDSPNPSPAGECAPHPRFWGKGHTRWRERGWESPNSDETVVHFIYKYFVVFTAYTVLAESCCSVNILFERRPTPCEEGFSSGKDTLMIIITPFTS